MAAEQHRARTCEECGRTDLDVSPTTLNGEQVNLCPSCSWTEVLRQR